MHTADGLNVSLAIFIQQGEDEVGRFSEKWLKNVQRLSSTPTDGEVVSNSQCQRCREDWEQNGPVCCTLNSVACVTLHKRLLFVFITSSDFIRNPFSFSTLSSRRRSRQGGEAEERS